MSKMFLCWSCKYVHPHQSILSLSPFFYYNMSQHGSINLEQLVRQQQEQAKLLKCHGGLNSFGVLENDIL